MLLPEYGELKKDFHCQTCCKHLVLWRAWPYAAMLKSVCPWWRCACLSYRLYRVAQIILVDDDTATQNTGFYSCSFEKNAVTTGKFKRENTRITISILLLCNYLNTVNIYHQHFFYNTPTALDYETSTKMKQNYRPSLSTVMFSIMSHRRCIVSLTCLLQIPWHQCSTT